MNITRMHLHVYPYKTRQNVNHTEQGTGEVDVTRNESRFDSLGTARSISMQHRPDFRWEFEIPNVAAHTPNVGEQHVRFGMLRFWR